MELEKIKIRWCRHHVLCLRRQLVLLLVARHHDHKKKLKKRTWKRLPPSLREAFLWFSSCIRARCLWHGGKISRNVAVVILVSGLYLFIPPPLFLCLQWGLLCSTDVWGGKLRFGEKLWRRRLCGRASALCVVCVRAGAICVSPAGVPWRHGIMIFHTCPACAHVCAWSPWFEADS